MTVYWHVSPCYRLIISSYRLHVLLVVLYWFLDVFPSVISLVLLSCAVVVPLLRAVWLTCCRITRGGTTTSRPKVRQSSPAPPWHTISLLSCRKSRVIWPCLYYGHIGFSSWSIMVEVVLDDYFCGCKDNKIIFISMLTIATTSSHFIHYSCHVTAVSLPFDLFPQDQTSGRCWASGTWYGRRTCTRLSCWPSSQRTNGWAT